MIDPAGFAENLALRKESARHTLRVASKEELHALIAELFADSVHPFYEPFSRFIEEHHSETAVRGETSDGIAFVYYPRTNRGMWTCTPASARALVYSGQIASKRFPNCARRRDFFNVAQMTRLRLLH